MTDTHGTGAQTAWIFPGQGSQYQNMGKPFDRAPEKLLLEQASEILKYPADRLIGPDPDGILNRTEWTQPALLLVSVLYIGRLREEGAKNPDLYLGHSLGEYSALVAADTLGFDDALHAVHLRGRFMQDAIPEGKGLMAAVLGMERDAIREVLEGLGPAGPGEYAGMANMNSPGQVVIAGSRERVMEASERLKAAGARKVVPLSVSVPSHTPLMESAAKKMVPVLERLVWNPPAGPVISNVTATPSTDPETLKERLVRQITAPVLWEDSIREAVRLGASRFLEVGPGTVLAGLGKRIEKNAVWESVDKGPG